MKRTVTCTYTVEVEVDRTKFTPEFFNDFNSTLFKATSIEDHVKHIASLEVSGRLYGDVEGYGNPSEMGIKADIIDLEMEVE